MLVSIWHVFYSHRGSVHQLDNTVLEDYMPLKLLTWIDQSITVYFHIPLLYIIRNVEGLYYVSSEAKMHASGAAVNKTCHAMYSHHLSLYSRYSEYIQCSCIWTCQGENVYEDSHMFTSSRYRNIY